MNRSIPVRGNTKATCLLMSFPERAFALSIKLVRRCVRSEVQDFPISNIKGSSSGLFGTFKKGHFVSV